MLELINVKKTYVTKAGDTVALNGINITFPDTGMVFITGKSGSGKTTLLNTIGGLDKIDEGEIIIDGNKFSEFTPLDYDSYRNTFVGFVFQEYNLLSEYTIEKNIKIADELQGKETNDEELEKLLTTFDVNGFATRKTNQLSGGQKQRIAIARALIKNPKIIMADEPTGALDSASGIQVMDLLKELSKDKLVIVVSHEKDFAEKYADRIIRIVDGRIVDDVTLKEVEISGNIYESDIGMSVKAGAELTKEETTQLLAAIKDKKKLRITEKLSVKEKQKTEPIKPDRNAKKTKLINSKMKFSSVTELGFKSLFVKPIRLIFTILLSVIAFSVFGLFDSIASYTSAKALTNLLRDARYDGVSVYQTYSDDYYTDAQLKLTQGQIDELSQKTGYNFVGIHDLVSADSDVMNLRNNFSRTFKLDVPTGNYHALGRNYYQRDVSGLIEFKADQIVETSGKPTQIDPKGFNYQVIAGTYPRLPNIGTTFDVGISSYLADSILYWIEINNADSFGGKKVEKIEDLVGAKLVLRSLPSNINFYVSAIIDCGEIDEKYDRLKYAKYNQEKVLVEDFITYLNSAGYLTLFAPVGYGDYINKENHRVTTYIIDYADKYYEIDNPSIMKKSASYNYYNVNEFDGTNSIIFDELDAWSSTSTPSLNANEVLINAANLGLVFRYEMNQAKEYDKDKGLEGAESYASKMDDCIYTIARINGIQSKIYAAQELLRLINEIRAYYPNIFTQDYTPTLTVKTFDTNREGSDKELKDRAKSFVVKGVYFDVNDDSYFESGESNKYYPLAMSTEGLKVLNINTVQGTYSRAIAPLTNNYSGAKTMANLLLEENGSRLHWYKNSILETINENEELISRFSQLFLYIAIVVVIFAVLMLFNYITTSIFSKRHTIGTLRALGASGNNIFQMFMTESFIISLINGILASVVAYFASTFVNSYVVNVMNLNIHFALFGFRQIIIIMLASIITGFLSSLSPILRISKQKPVELIRKDQ